jgi:hypothetical protein
VRGSPARNDCVESATGANAETELVSDRVTVGWDRWNATAGTQRPVQFHLLIEGKIDEARLRSAWQKMAERWSGANASPEYINGKGAGSKGRRAPWQKHDLRNLPRDEARKWIKSFLETDAQQGISAERLPSMRCALLIMDERECELV